MSLLERFRRLIGYDPDAPMPGYEDDYVPAAGQHPRAVRRLDCGHTSNRYATDRDGRTTCLDCHREMTS